jgi:hypothetical protein
MAHEPITTRTLQGEATWTPHPNFEVINEPATDPFKCPACGQKKRKPRTEQTKDATPKERSRVRIDIPVAERATGYDDFSEMLGQAKERFGPELGYTQDTPNWYVLFAVLRDWLDSEPKTSGLRETGEAA